MAKKTKNTRDVSAPEATSSASETVVESTGAAAVRKRVSAASAEPAPEAKTTRPAAKKTSKATAGAARPAAKRKAAAAPAETSVVAEKVTAKPSRPARTRGAKPAVTPVVAAEETAVLPAASNGVPPQPARYEELSFPTEAERAEIERLAYGYWEQRGYQAGDPFADWLRAEADVRTRRNVVAIA